MDRLLRSSFLSNLFAYLKYRYFLQDIEFNEDISMYEDLFSNGQRVFHGVLLERTIKNLKITAWKTFYSSKEIEVRILKILWRPV
jgi:hypothetical protein